MPRVVVVRAVVRWVQAERSNSLLVLPQVIFHVLAPFLGVVILHHLHNKKIIVVVVVVVDQTRAMVNSFCQAC